LLAVHTKEESGGKRTANAKSRRNPQKKGTGGMLRIDFGKPESGSIRIDWDH